ncbi:hypothetical protein HY468_02620 [Candidatus Roizmanbacteria bacterium]|nr:hypothetical protein [Candidatus Roizmanbacteria bacterium]
MSKQDGSTFVIYKDQVDGGGIYVQLIDSLGNPVWPNDGVRIGSSVSWTTPSIAIVDDEGEGIVIVWEQRLNGKPQVYAQRIKKDGSLLWGVNGLLVSSDQNFFGRLPQVTNYDDGIIVSWVRGNSGGGVKVTMQKISFNGSFIWDQQGIDLTGWRVGPQDTKIVSDKLGGAFVLYWGTNSQILLIQHVDINGNILWSSSGKFLSDVATSSLSRYGFVSDNSGGVFVRWITSQNSVSEVHYQRVKSDGSFLWGANGLIYPFSGDIISDDLGNLYVISNPRIDPWNLDIDIYKLLGDGSLGWNGNATQIVQKPGAQFLSDVFNDNSNGFIIAWYDQNTKEGGANSNDPNEPSESDIYAQRIDVSGNVLWSQGGIIISNSPSAQVGAVIDQLNNTSFILAWTDERNGNNRDDIYAQKVNLDGTLGDIPIPSPIPTATPTPTPEPCVLTHFPDPVTQTDQTWGSIAYGGTYAVLKGKTEKELVPFKDYELNPNSTRKDSIAEWGCNLTANAMNINYYAKLQDVKDDAGNLFRTDPQVLNEWLQKNNGYDTGKVLYDNDNHPYVAASGVMYGPVERYAKKNGVKLSYGRNLKYKPDKPDYETGESFTATHSATLEQNLCALQPALLHVRHPSSTIQKPGHFVVATGVQYENDTVDTWRIHDPLSSVITKLQDDYSDIFYGLLVATTKVPDEFLTIIQHSPTELVLTDPTGKKIGYNPLQEITYSEIEDSFYGDETLTAASGDATQEQKVLTIKSPPQGNYTIDVFGTGVGEYTLETVYSVGDEIYKAPFVTDQTENGQIRTYMLPFDTTGDLIELIQQVIVDVDPHDKKNRPIYTDRSNIVHIAILTTDTFDAALVDRQTVTAGPAATKPHGAAGVLQDVNGDKQKDLMFLFKANGLGLTPAVTQLCVTGKTTAGQAVVGCDEVIVQ